MRTFSLQAEDVRNEEHARRCVGGTNLGTVLADLTASQTVILALKGSLPGGMANTRHMESGVTEGDSLYDVGIWEKVPSVTSSSEPDQEGGG